MHKAGRQHRGHGTTKLFPVWRYHAVFTDSPAEGPAHGEIAAHLHEIYRADVSKQTITTITDRLMDGMAVPPAGSRLTRSCSSTRSHCRVRRTPAGRMSLARRTPVHRCQAP
jgi:hypothetical protein